MKLHFRNVTIILTTLIFALFIGCGEDDEPEPEPVLDFVGVTWQLVSINGVPLEKLFTRAETDPNEPELEAEFTLGGNSVSFDADGTLTSRLEFMLTAKDTEAGTTMTQEVTITTDGEYTADDTTLNITRQENKVDVVVKLDPIEVWEQQIQGITLEAFKNDLAEESKQGIEATASGAFLKVGTEYTWDVQDDTFTLNNDQQKIVLKKSG